MRMLSNSTRNIPGRHQAMPAQALAKITVKHVAVTADVSVGTVSRVSNNFNDVNAEAWARVVAAVDVSIVSCNNEEPLVEGISPRLTSVDVHASKIEALAVNMLLWRIAHRDEPVPCKRCCSQSS